MGIIDQQMQPPQPAAPAAQGAPEAAPEAAPQGGGGEATPQEQEAYERVVMAGMKVLYDESTHPAVMKMLAGGEAPEKDISDTVVMVMLQLDKKSGGKIPQVVIIPAAVELTSLAAELGTQAGIFQADDRIVARAVQMVMIGLGQEYGVDPAEVQEVINSLDPETVRKMVDEQRQMTADPQGAPAATPEQPAEEAPV